MTIENLPPPSERMDMPAVEAAVGKPPGTILTWIKRGVRGQKLQAFRIGHKHYVTRSELNRFLTATNSK